MCPDRKISKIKMITTSKWLTLFQALRVETANLLYFSGLIIRLLYKVADFVTEY